MFSAKVLELEEMLEKIKKICFFLSVGLIGLAACFLVIKRNTLASVCGNVLFVVFTLLLVIKIVEFFKNKELA